MEMNCSSKKGGSFKKEHVGRELGNKEILRGWGHVKRREGRKND